MLRLARLRLVVIAENHDFVRFRRPFFALLLGFGLGEGMTGGCALLFILVEFIRSELRVVKMLVSLREGVELSVAALGSGVEPRRKRPLLDAGAVHEIGFTQRSSLPAVGGVRAIDGLSAFLVVPIFGRKIGFVVVLVGNLLSIGTRSGGTGAGIDRGEFEGDRIARQPRRERVELPCRRLLGDAGRIGARFAPGAGAERRVAGLLIGLERVADHVPVHFDRLNGFLRRISPLLVVFRSILASVRRVCDHRAADVSVFMEAKIFAPMCVAVCQLALFFAAGFQTFRIDRGFAGLLERGSLGTVGALAVARGIGGVLGRRAAGVDASERVVGGEAAFGLFWKC